ncbi:MAG: ATP-binding cassette domain-containing protein [Lachnospiraceae bacterium]|nr:ATP-binding cassette domain-containing protein [Lachnospiraceae bacterium]
MLQFKNVTITHRKDLRVILEDFHCVLHAGDKAVMIGEEGNGKSTLLKWMYEPTLLDGYAQYQGERVIPHERLAYLPQELSLSDASKTVYEFFSEKPCFWEKNPGELAKQAKLVGLTAEIYYLDQQMGCLSGGEKVKVQMLRLLLTDPAVLLLDEPSNDIDIETLQWMEELIAGWPNIVVFISHDEVLIEHTANMVIHLEQVYRKQKSRCTVVRMPWLSYTEERLHQFQKQRQLAVNDQREKRMRDEKYRRMEQQVQNNLRETKNDHAGRLLKKKMHAVKSMEHRFERENAKMVPMPVQEEAIFFKMGGKETKIPAGKTVLECEIPELFTTDGSWLLAKNVRLRIRGAERVVIVGKNGVGKTTLLRKIAEELLSRSDIRAGYMPQNYEELLPARMNVIRYLSETGEKEEQTRLRTYLGALKFTEDEMLHPLDELSGGQRAKVLLLKLSLSGANVLILDEPTRNFSPLSGPVIRTILREFPGAIISVSHDRKYIDEVCTKIYELTADGLKAVGR